MMAVAELDPVTIFHEPINIRAENVARIEEHARSIGVAIDTSVFSARQVWEDYAMHALQQAEDAARACGVFDRLHLWPDKSLGSKQMLKRLPDPAAHLEWLHSRWHRVSEWPTEQNQPNDQKTTERPR